MLAARSAPPSRAHANPATPAPVWASPAAVALRTHIFARRVKREAAASLPALPSPKPNTKPDPEAFIERLKASFEAERKGFLATIEQLHRENADLRRTLEMERMCARKESERAASLLATVAMELDQTKAKLAARNNKREKRAKVSLKRRREDEDGLDEVPETPTPTEARPQQKRRISDEETGRNESEHLPVVDGPRGVEQGATEEAS